MTGLACQNVTQPPILLSQQIQYISVNIVVHVDIARDAHTTQLVFYIHFSKYDRS